MCLACVPQLSFAAMHISSHRALDYIPPLHYGAIRIGCALPLLALSARVQVHTRAFCTLGMLVLAPFFW